MGCEDVNVTQQTSCERRVGSGVWQWFLLRGSRTEAQVATGKRRRRPRCPSRDKRCKVQVCRHAAAPVQEIEPSRSGPLIFVDACRTMDAQGGVRVGPEMWLGHSFRKRITRPRSYLCPSRPVERRTQTGQPFPAGFHKAPTSATACESWVPMVCPCGKAKGAQTRPYRRSLRRQLWSRGAGLRGLWVASLGWVKELPLQTLENGRQRAQAATPATAHCAIPECCNQVPPLRHQVHDPDAKTRVSAQEAHSVQLHGQRQYCVRRLSRCNFVRPVVPGPLFAVDRSSRHFVEIRSRRHFLRQKVMRKEHLERLGVPTNRPCRIARDLHVDETSFHRRAESKQSVQVLAVPATRPRSPHRQRSARSHHPAALGPNGQAGLVLPTTTALHPTFTSFPNATPSLEGNRVQFYIPDPENIGRFETSGLCSKTRSLDKVCFGQKLSWTLWNYHDSWNFHGHHHEIKKTFIFVVLFAFTEIMKQSCIWFSCNFHGTFMMLFLLRIGGLSCRLLVWADSLRCRVHREDALLLIVKRADRVRKVVHEPLAPFFKIGLRDIFDARAALQPTLCCRVVGPLEAGIRPETLLCLSRKASASFQSATALPADARSVFMITKLPLASARRLLPRLNSTLLTPTAARFNGFNILYDQVGKLLAALFRRHLDNTGALSSGIASP